jgi:hypothetical protein
MKFSHLAVLAVVAVPVTSFVPQRFSQRTQTQSFMAIEDLESKLFSPAPTKAAAPNKKDQKKDSAAKPNKANAGKAPKQESLLSSFEVEYPSSPSTGKPKVEPKKAVQPKKAPVAKPEPKAKPDPFKSDLVAKKPALAPKPAAPVKAAPKPKPAPVARVETPKPKPKALAPPAPPKAPARVDGNAVPAGIALGAAPLVLAPLLALSAARETLGKTAARRQQIQDEIAASKAAIKRKQNAQVDSGGLVGALVSI